MLKTAQKPTKSINFRFTHNPAKISIFETSARNSSTRSTKREAERENNTLSQKAEIHDYFKTAVHFYKGFQIYKRFDIILCNDA